MRQQFEIILPAPEEAATLSQDEAYFDLLGIDGSTRRIRFHDYDVIYSYPGLYEQLFHRHLRCNSPRKVVSLLEGVVSSVGEDFDDLRVLDFGAGNGMVASELVNHGVSHIVGVDILPEARAAAERDRPIVYDDYYVGDFSNLPESAEAQLREHRFNGLVTIAALGFGDIPTTAFAKALSLISDDGWIAFNLKEAFFEREDKSGFDAMIKRLVASSRIQILHLERYQHRLSVARAPIFYYAFICRKQGHIEPQDFGG